MARVREFDTDQAVAAAMGVFRRFGFEGASVQDLVDATGVGRGSLYAAFGSKEGLYLAALDRYRDEFAVPVAELLRCGKPTRDVVRHVLVSVVDAIVDDTTRQSCLIVSAAAERVAHDPPAAERVAATTQILEDAFAAAIRAGQRSGEVTSTRPARDLARFMVTTIHGLRVSGAIHPRRRALMSIVDIAPAILD